MTATATISFRERVEQAFADMLRERESEQAVLTREQLERTLSEARKLINEVLGADVNPDFGFSINTEGWPTARFTVDGIPFCVGYHESEYSSSWHLYVESRCTRAGCTKQDLPATIEVFDISAVGEALQRGNAVHAYNLHCADATSAPADEDTLGAHQRATDAYAAAVRQRRDMEFQRSIEKAAAIQRVLDSKLATSATGAEKLVESEPGYAKFCAALTDAVIAEITAREALCVARLRAGMPAFVEHDR